MGCGLFAAVGECLEQPVNSDTNNAAVISDVWYFIKCECRLTSNGRHIGRLEVRHGASVWLGFRLCNGNLWLARSAILIRQRRQVGEPAAGPGGGVEVPLDGGELVAHFSRVQR